MRPKARPVPRASQRRRHTGASGVSDSEITGSEAAGVKMYKILVVVSSIFFGIFTPQNLGKHQD